MNRALLALDDHTTSRSLAMILMESGCEVTEAASVADAQRLLRSRSFNLLFTQSRLPDGTGAALVEEGDASCERTVLVGAAPSEPDGARSNGSNGSHGSNGSRGSNGSHSSNGSNGSNGSHSSNGSNGSNGSHGSDGFTHHLALPLTPLGVWGILGDGEPARDGRGADGPLDPMKMLGESPVIRDVLARLGRIGPTRATVLISGETGTGKEVAGRAVHRLSERRDQPFVAVNCGAISPSLMESELFGHERGSFTGATRRHRGLFERADGGTLFLDEITEMPSDLQVKLLRVLEEGRIVRTGGEESIEVDVRIIATTNGEAETAIEEGRLREDLYYRLKVLHVTMPPLRDRGRDVIVLARAFLDEVCATEGKPKRFTPEAEEVLMRYCWPGNVRELRNAVHSAYLMAEGELVRPRVLPEEVRQGVPDLRFFRGSVIRVPLGTPIREVERRLVLGTLDRMKGHRGRTAETLGISLKTLYNRLQTYGYAEMENGDHASGSLRA